MQLDDWVVDILMGDELTKTDHRLFWYLFKLERWGDRFVDLPSQSKIALVLGVCRQSINQSQAKLQELGLWDFKTTGWKARNLVGPKSYTVLEKTDTELEKNETDIHKENTHAFQTNKDSSQTEEESVTAAETEVVEVEVLEKEVDFTPLVEWQRLGHRSVEKQKNLGEVVEGELVEQGEEITSFPSNHRQDEFFAADPHVLQEIERIVYDWRLRPWMKSPNTFKPEVVQSVWQCNTQWYSLESSKTPNLKKIGDRLRRLDGQLKKLDSDAIQAYSELQNYWSTAQAITNPEIEQAFNQAAIRQKQQRTRSSIEQALDRPEGGIF